MSAERHLLFAVLAFENELIDLVQLTSACRAWATDKSKPLADLLVERGWINAEDRGFLEKQLERKLAKHQNDARVTLNAVTRGDVCRAIKQVEDADIQQSLSSWPSGGPVQIETTGETLVEPEQLKSRYTWVSEVGKGGLGRVSLARDNDLAREVAIKEVKPGSASQDAVQRLIKEAQITGQLQHPNIVPVYELNRGARPFYTMKLVKGESLSKAIKKHHEQVRAGREDPLSLPRLLNVFVNVCEALAYAHWRGIIHRDLKPANIVLGDYGEAIVVDWGLAKHVGTPDEETAPVVLTDDAQSRATRLGDTLGTPKYMSPEQAAGRVDLLDQRTDVYGLGTILFEILTGHPPHRTAAECGVLAPLSASVSAAAPTEPFLSSPDKPHSIEEDLLLGSPCEIISDLLQRISEGPTPRARELDPTISRELDAICATAMAREQDERYLDAKDLAADVKRSLAHQPVSVYHAGLWERLRLWHRRNPTVAALSATVALVLLIGMAVSWFFASQSSQRANALANKQGELTEETKRANRKADEADENAKLAQRHLYVADMNLTQLHWENNRVGLVLDRLEQHRLKPDEMPKTDDLRGFEWYYWDRLCHSSLLDLKGQTGWVSSVAFRPDGQRLASASWDQTVKVWDTTTGQESLTLKGHTHWVTSVAFRPDGQRLATASGDKTVKVWDATTGQESLTLKGHTQAVWSVTFRPDGQRLASASADKTIKVWDETSGQESLTLNGHSDQVYSVAFSPDGQRLASASADETVKLWDATTGQELLTLKGHIGEVVSVAFSPDGQRLASASWDGTVKVWDATTGQESLTLKGHTGRVYSVAFSPDGQRLASTSGEVNKSGEVKIWDATKGQESLTLKGHTGRVSSVAFCSDGQRLASASEDQTVKVWDATTGQESLTLKGHTGLVWSVAFRPDGQRLASASSDQTVKVWDATTGQESLTLKGHIDRVRSVAFRPDGQRLASASWDKTVKVWDATTGQESLTLNGHTDVVESVAFSPDGQRLASASEDQTVKVWDATTGQELLTLKGHTDVVESVAFSPDGQRLASASYDQTVKLWNATTGQESLTLKGHTGGLVSVAFSPDGQRLATASDDKTVKVWDAITGQESLTLKGHTSGVNSVAFSPDGQRLASASVDGTVKVWDATTGQESLTLKGHTSLVRSVAFSPDGQRLASASSDQTVRVWDARPRPEVSAILRSQPPAVR